MTARPPEPEPGTPAPRRSRILALSMPVVISFGLRSVYALVDSAFAAQLEGIGDASVAAIGFTVPLEFLMTACWVGASSGLTARLSAAMGAREDERVAALLSATMRIVFVLVGLFLGLAGVVWFTAEHLGLDADVGRQLKIYASVLIGGQALTAFWSILPDSLVKAHHDMKSTMWAGLISGLTNVVFNALFVFVFGWGIFGIAFSTVVSRLFSYAYAARRAAAHERRRQEEWGTAPNRVASPEAAALAVRDILVIAVPSAISFVLLAGESLAVNWIVATWGGGAAEDGSTAALAAWSIFDRGARFLAMPMIAVGVAMLPLVARLWGERDLAHIRRELAVAARFGLAYVLLVVTPALLLAGDEIADFFTQEGTARRLVASGILWLPFSTLAAIPFFVLRSAFEGLSQPRPALVVSAVRGLLLVVPLTLAGAIGGPALGVTPMIGVYAGSTLGTGLASAWMLLWMRGLLRRLESPGGPDPRAGTDVG